MGLDAVELEISSRARFTFDFMKLCGRKGVRYLFY